VYCNTINSLTFEGFPFFFDKSSSPFFLRLGPKYIEYIIGLNASFQEFIQVSVKGADAITN
jgi:hypothetical protein